MASLWVHLLNQKRFISKRALLSDLTLSTCYPLRPAVIHHLRWLPERPRGRHQSLPGGSADEGAVEERAAGSGRQGGGSQQPESQQRTFRKGLQNTYLYKTRLAGRVWLWRWTFEVIKTLWGARGKAGRSERDANSAAVADAVTLMRSDTAVWLNLFAKHAGISWSERQAQETLSTADIKTCSLSAVFAYKCFNVPSASVNKH